jgi:hypothetical protein
VSSGGKSVSVTLVGSYSVGNFHITAGQGGTPVITDPTAVAQGIADFLAAGGFISLMTQDD